MYYCLFPVMNGLEFTYYTFVTQYEPNQQKILTQENNNDCKNYFSPLILTKNEPIVQSEEEPTVSNLKNQKSNIIINNQDNDQQYVPIASSSSIKKQKKKSNQLENRNVVPNMIRLVLSFIQKKGKSMSLVQKLLRLHNPDPENYTTQRFYLFQKAIKEKMNNYVNIQTLRLICKIRKQQFSVFSFEEQRCYNKITNILINYFLKEEILVFILTSKRMQKQKKRYHVQAIRQLQESLKTLLSQQ